jgi:sec-independent protein translocase protein TatC
MFLASPVLFYQIWRFISPGLHRNERRYTAAFVGSSVVLFALGAACAYITMPKALDFLLTVGGDQIEQLMRVSSYMSFLMFTMLAFGIGFQFPILLIALQLVGILQTSTLVRWRRESFVGIVFIAAILTPSVDPFSLFALAIPMYLFYEASILVGRWLSPRHEPA